MKYVCWAHMSPFIALCLIKTHRMPVLGWRLLLLPVTFIEPVEALSLDMGELTVTTAKQDVM